MKIVLRIMMISLLFVVISRVSYAQGEAAVPFLLLAPDSRAGGIGETGGVDWLIILQLYSGTGWNSVFNRY